MNLWRICKIIIDAGVFFFERDGQREDSCSVSVSNGRISFEQAFCLNGSL